MPSKWDRRSVGFVSLRLLTVSFLLLTAIAVRVGSFNTARRLVSVSESVGRLLPMAGLAGMRFDETKQERSVPSATAISASVSDVDRSLLGTRSCLVRALAVRMLCHLFEHETTLRIGVDPRGKTFEAHAWVEHEETTLVGHPHANTYAPLPPLNKV